MDGWMKVLVDRIIPRCRLHKNICKTIPNSLKAVDGVEWQGADEIMYES